MALRWHPPSRRPPHQMMSPKCGTFQQQQQRCGWGRKWEIMIGASVFEIFQSKPMCLWNDISPTHVIHGPCHLTMTDLHLHLELATKKFVEGSPHRLAQAWTWKGKNVSTLLTKINKSRCDVIFSFSIDQVNDYFCYFEKKSLCKHTSHNLQINELLNS